VDVAIIGAAGSCGRQFAAQVLERELLSSSARLQLVGHRGGKSEHELFGLRADLEDAFVNHAPSIEVALDPEEVSADVIVMLAGVTLPTDPNAHADRAELGRQNLRIFRSYAQALDSNNPPLVIVQSNPVELGVHVFAERIGASRVLGAGSLSDTLRFRQEIAVELGVRRPQVSALMIGQHGDSLVPLWSSVQVNGVDAERVTELREAYLPLVPTFPDRLREARAEMLHMLKTGDVSATYAFVQGLPVDVRSAVKPIFTHFTAGHTTEMATAHSVAEMLAVLMSGQPAVLPAQVSVDAPEYELTGVVGLPVLVTSTGWTEVVGLHVTEIEGRAVQAASASINAANAAHLSQQD
jgi:malate dehydrogenase